MFVKGFSGFAGLEWKERGIWNKKSLGKSLSAKPFIEIMHFGASYHNNRDINQEKSFNQARELGFLLLLLLWIWVFQTKEIFAPSNKSEHLT